ncbi:uncharacterized protein LOC112521487 isoform X1 [Cynara cardunculus var. scolymus]|uniref:uncharacterized protein LOC112521487 isoform X1 n=1 Tax=Cynara cardunculus var. scolymus TaxID=59895 RepID=UPI000D629425|nr:uncharacterized protein LOC112521487 isoform X1 [Cynara cardunculus var. scolymus]
MDSNHTLILPSKSKQGLHSETRHISPHSPLHKSSSNSNTDVASKQRNSLEKDIEQLQMRLQQEKSVRMLLERALGRTSSTLSPGHRHSANQTKELIAEIELLEEEVVNREQHVLTLYRTIFEQCVSRPSSQQSSLLTSPAHAKKESRKHPTIISSTFCSSNSFPFRNFHALSTMNTPGKGNLLQSKMRHPSLFRSKANNCFETTSSDDVKKKKGNPSATSKPSVQLTLKDHLYQCPSRLSEEMVKSMAAVYCWLCSPSSTDLEHKKSSSSRRLSTIGEECESMVEISWISTDRNNFSRASYAINNYRLLVEQLERLNLSQMETNAQIAFWINMYNSMIMHAYLAYGIPHNSLRRLALFHKAAYKIGGHVISANAIEQAIFKFRTPRVGKWLETILSTALWKKSGEERQRISTKFGLEYQPLLCFALCTGTSSDPVLKVYTPSNIKEELEAAKREFLQSNIIVKKSKKLFIPKLLERFGKETNISPDNLLKWITENVDKKLGDSITKCIEHKTSKKSSQMIEWLPYNSRFRYVFSKDLSEKPWWL